MYLSALKNSAPNIISGHTYRYFSTCLGSHRKGPFMMCCSSFQVGTGGIGGASQLMRWMMSLSSFMTISPYPLTAIRRRCKRGTSDRRAVKSADMKPAASNALVTWCTVPSVKVDIVYSFLGHVPRGTRLVLLFLPDNRVITAVIARKL